MKAKLTEEDIKKLKYELRVGLLFALFFSVFGIAGIILSLADNDFMTAAIIFAITLIIGFAVFFLINQKKLTDIGNNEKIVGIKIIEKKKSRTDWEVGSGKPAGEMKAFDLYEFIIDGIPCKVEKELYDKCNAGDELVFHIAPKSGYILKIEKNELFSGNTSF